MNNTKRNEYFFFELMDFICLFQYKNIYVNYCPNFE